MAEIIETDITHNLTLACLLEASVPKPGNISPLHSLHSTSYEHYLAGSVAVGQSLGRLAEPGTELTVGEAVLSAVTNMKARHSGGNTHLGIILLLAPLTKAAVQEDLTVTTFRENLNKILNELDYKDTELFYQSINLAEPGGLPEVAELDVTKPSTLDKITSQKISVKNWMDVSRDTNSVSYEYVTGFELTFELGLPFFTKLLGEDNPLTINDAVLRLYLKFLSNRLDTLVIGKFDSDTARKVQADAKELLSLIDSSDPHAQAQTQKFHEDLTAKKINPGMSADLVASTIFVALSLGLKI
jgi:triphosphoribosyl-dephospho-CoA synthase